MAKNKNEDNAEISDKRKALEYTRDQIEKKFGKGSLMLLSQESNIFNVECISSGAISLDEILGGGYPKGRIVEIYGPESSGKTTLALHAIAESQKLGGECAFIDAEHAFDSVYSSKIGVQKNKLWVSQPDSGEQALEIAENLARSGAVDIIVIDSVAALVPESEIKGDMGQSQVGTQARLMSQALRKLSSVVSKSGTIIIFINQIRMKIGVMFGNPETTSGGNALKFYASVRLDVRKGEMNIINDEPIGSKTNIKVVKNKIAPPFKKISLDMIFGEGISSLSSLIDTATKYNLIQKSGSWYSHNDTKIGQGKDNVKKYLKENPELITLLNKELREIIFTKEKISENEIREEIKEL